MGTHPGGRADQVVHRAHEWEVVARLRAGVHALGLEDVVVAAPGFVAEARHLRQKQRASEDARHRQRAAHASQVVLHHLEVRS